MIRSVVTIAGRGSTIVRDREAQAFRILAVSRTGDLTLTETTVSGGRVPAGDLPGNSDGGGISNFGGILTVTNSTLAGNRVDNGYGGGVANLGGTLTITDSTLVGNIAFSGGGVANYSSDSTGTVTVTNSTIADNAAFGSGGGVSELYGGTVTVTNSTLSGNTAFDIGGGVDNSGILTVTNSTIADNVTFGDGGGVANFWRHRHRDQQHPVGQSGR